MAEKLPSGREAPKELRLFKPGRNRTQLNVPGGYLFYDVKRIKEMKRQQAKTEGRDRLHFDLNHYSVDGQHATVEANKSFGDFRVEYRPTGVFAADIQWTDEGRQLVESKAFRYYSPTCFTEDGDSNVVMTIHSVALTNTPARLNIRPLTLSTTSKGKDMEDNKTETKVEETEEQDTSKEAEGEELPATEEEKDQLIESLKAELDAAYGRIIELEERIDALDEGSEADAEETAEAAKERSPLEIVEGLVKDGYVLASAAPRMLKLSRETLEVADKDRRSRPPVLKAPKMESAPYKRTASADNAPQKDITQNRVYQAFTNGQSIKA